MANVNANINVLVTTQQAQAQLAAMQAKINAFNKAVVASSGVAVAQQAAMNKALMDGAVASKMFTARMIPVASAVSTFTTSLEKNRFSLRQYTRFAASQLPGMSRVFKKEFETINRVAQSNVRRLQTQFTAAGTAANGMRQAIALTPTALNKMSAGYAIANQRAMIFNRLLRDGSTSLLNWGKNTQWAGRQLMVGFTIPLAIFAGLAAKTFKDLEAQAINFKKVYGDIFTSDMEVERNLQQVKELSLELTKYGIAVKDTMELAGIAAQAGMRGAELMAVTTESTRLSVLGQMEQAEAIKTVISMQTAFGQSNEDLTESVNFLNVIENQTVLSLQDVASAIPRVAPVIKGLGGDVKDLAILLVAMREGGVSAAEGANALKNSLGRLISPTKAASNMAEEFGINLDAIVLRNRGEVLPMIKELASAMQNLGGLEEQKLLSAIFGKFQYARIGALMKNIRDESSQAARAMDLMGMSTEDLAKTAEQELAVVENAVSTKFTAAMERAKVAIAPIGEQFLKALTPILNFLSDLFEKFNSLSDNVKNAFAIILGVIGGVAPIALMVIGLIANLMANGLKFINVLRGLFAKLRGTGQQFQYMAIAEQEAALASASLEGRVGSLTGKILMQQSAVATLTRLYGSMAAAAQSAAAAMPMAMGMGMAAAPRGGGRSGFGAMNAPPPNFKGYNKGVVPVPGSGNKDTIPALLTPGESVVTKDATQKYAPIIAAMNSGTLPGFIDGLSPQVQVREPKVQVQSPHAPIAGHMGGSSLLNVKQQMALVQSNISAYSNAYVEQLKSLDKAGVQTVRVYTNNVALMTGALNDSISKGTATFADVKAQIGNPAAQVELKRQLQILGLQDDEITGLVNKYVTNLNQQLDAAQARLGTAPIPAPQMDRALLRSAAAAGGRTFTDPGQRGMFASMLKTPTTFVPGDSDGKGRRQIASAGAAKADPSTKSYVGLRGGYGVSAATKFNVADLERARISVEKFKATFASLKPAAQQAVIATRGNLSQALQIFAQEGKKLGTAYGSETVKSAEQTVKPLVQRVLAASGHASAAPAMGKAGTQDGQLYGKSWSAAVRKAIMTGKGTILPPGTPPGGTPLASSGSPSPRINPKENEALIKGLIGGGSSEVAPQMLSVRQSAAGASREVAGIFRLLPQTAFEIARNFEESAKIAGGIITQIAGPYVKPIVNGFKFLKDTVVFNIRGVAKVFSDGIVSAAESAKTVAQNAALKVKGAYETLAIKTILALDGVKALPTKIRSSYETAALRLMMGLDSIKNFPNKVRGKVAQLTQDLPQNIRRLQNKMFYGAQDLAGSGARARAGEMLGSARERIGAFGTQARATGITAYNALLARDVKMFIKALTPDRVWAASSRLATAISGAAQSVGGAIKLASDTIMFNARAAIALGPAIIKDGFIAVKSSLIEGAKFVKDTIALNLRTAIVVGANDIKNAFNSAKTFISQGGRFILDTIKLNIGAALFVAKGEITRIAEILRTEGPKLRTALTQAGKGVAGAIKGAGTILAQSIRGVGSMVAAAGRGAAGFFSGGVDAMGKSRGQRMAGMGNNAMMGLMGVSMAASMAGGEIGEMAQKIMPVTMGLFALQMILPMLKSPLGLLILVAGGLAAGFIYLRKKLDDAAKAAAQMGANIGGMANSMKVIEEATGFKPPKLEDRLFRFTDEDREAMSEFGEYFQSEAGSKFIKELKEASSEERYERVRFLLAQGIASGLEEDKAKAFGQAIAEATGDALLNSSIARDFANQMFDQGSQGLIELEKNRLALAPEIPTSLLTKLPGQNQMSFELNSIGEIRKELSGVEQALEVAAILVSGIVGVDWRPFSNAVIEIEKLKEPAKGLGFALQTIQNLANAEAVLEEERRNGLITFSEYQDRFSELNSLQEDSADYIGKIFSSGADVGSMMQALEDQLSFQNFNEDQIKRISDRFSPDALAKQIFGEDKDFSSLDKEQKEYVEEVFTRVMSGLTPENIPQRLNDVEGTYSSMAERYMDAVNSGFEEGVDAWFQTENIAEFISERMSGGIVGTDPQGRQGPFVLTSPEQLAQNVTDVDMDLKGLKNGGTDSMEVFVALTKFLNQDFAKEIMNSKDRILDFGQALATLKDYEKINIELFIQDPDFDEDELKDQLDLMKNIEFDKKTFGENAKKIGKALGTNLIDPQAFANALAKSGESIDEFFTKYVDSAKKVGEEIMDLPAKAFDKMGRLKPEVLVSILPNLLGVTEESAAGIAATLNAAFPDSLSPIQLQILVSLGGEGAGILAQMQGDAAFKDAILKATPGENVVIKGYAGPGTSFSVPDQVVSANQVALAQLFFSADTGGFKPPPVKEKPSGSSGNSGSGGGDKKDPLKDFMDSIMEQTNKFTNLAKLLNGKYKGAKNALNKALNDPNFGFAGSFADKMRKAGLSEKLIADILSKGVEEATVLWNNFSNTTKKGVTVLTKAGKQAMKLSAAGDIGEAIRKLKNEKATNIAKIGFRERLKAEGMEAEDIKEVLSSTDGALILGLMSVDKNSKLWKQWSKGQKEAKTSSEALEEPINASTKALEAQSETMDYVNKNFAKQVAEFEFQAYLDFAAAHGKTVEEMQREISANERLIDGHKDRIGLIQKEIQALERRRDTTGDIGKMGLEQLQREVELNNQAIRSLERRNELDQRRIDTLNRQDQIRNRVSDALGYELELMSQQESKINEAYDERFKALDKVSKINDHLINQQRQQLGLSQAIAEGDIYAATAAAQEMRASSAQFARDQMRTGLETARENQIEGLRTEGGLSRDQAEERIAAIKEQSYQTSLMIRDIEDAIYERNLNEILPLKDKQFNLESAIQGINNQIFEKQQQILQIERDKIEPLEETNSKLDRALKYHNDMKDEAIEQMKVNGLTQGEWDKLNSKIVAGLEYSELMTKDTLAARDAAGLLAEQWQNVAAQVNSAYKAMRDEYAKIDTLKIKEGETQKDFDARREAARNAARNDYNERLEDIMSGAPARFTGALSGTSSPTESKKQPSNAARGLKMPGGRLTIGEAFDQGIVYLGGNGRLRWSSNRQLVKGVDGSDLSKYAMGGKVKGYGKGGKMLRYPMGGLIPYALGGSVAGDGSRDSVMAKLTPGEFVIRKSMVGKYGIPMLDALNQGAFNFPKYNMGNEDPVAVKSSTNTANINAPVYNTYDMKFAVSGTNASADEIANKVMFKMKQVQGQGIRSNRGY